MPQDPMAMGRAMQAIMAQAPQWLAAYKAELAAKGLGFSAEDIAAIDASAVAHPLPPSGGNSEADQAAIARATAQVAETIFPEAGSTPTTPARPINGVSIPAYAVAAKAIGWASEDQALITRVTAALGISAADWDAASKGWTQRLTDDMVVATMYGQLFNAAADLPKKR